MAYYQHAGIRDPVFFDPWVRIRERFYPAPESLLLDPQTIFSVSLVTIFGVKHTLILCQLVQIFSASVQEVKSWIRIRIATNVSHNTS
jgi:hypothetical protein